MSIYFWFQFALLIAFLFISAPRGGMFLGLFSGIGLIVIMFGPKPWIGLPPGKPPVDVILTIIAVVAAGSTLQASGGLDCMLQIAEKILRKRPKVVTFLAPLCTFTLTILCVQATRFTHSSPLFMTSQSRPVSVRNVRWQLPLSLLRWV